MSREPIEPGFEQVLEFCARDPVERVFLEDVARRGLGRFVALAGRRTARSRRSAMLGANLVPSGEGCGAFAGARRASAARG